ncbi:MAG: HD domain-containing protein [Clostridia bacterium]|nr:HD domain-containing protein [Clostridia bacterium]
MKQWKAYRFILFIAFCILLNFAGRLFSASLSLPLWLDSFGTVICAYIAGPFCGAVVGLTGNLLYSMINRASWAYAIISIPLGVIVGFAAKKKFLDSLFGTMTISAIASVIAVALSVPLNFLMYGNKTGNIWGDGVIGLLTEWGAPLWAALTVGEFYLEFLDKLLTLMILYGVLCLYKHYKNKKKQGPALPEAGKTACLILALLLCLPAHQASAQEASGFPGSNYNDYVQTVYSSKNGLPCGEANDIAQTNDGILWVGTYAGLYRYNGREFKAMNYDSVRNVNCLFADDEGRLWIGTNDNGLSILINNKIINVVDPSRGLPSYSVRSILQSSDSYYYIGTTASMQVFSLNSGLKTVNTLREVNYADDLSADQTGQVAAVTSDGRLFLLKAGQIVSSLQMTNGKEVFKSCGFAPDGTLYAGTTANHIFLYDVSFGGFQEIGSIDCKSLNSIKDITFLENGEMFVCADNGIGYVEQDGASHKINTNDFNNSIDNMLIDYQGNLWFTSSRLGLLRLAPSAFLDVYSTAGMARRVVNTVVQWQGIYYFGTDKGLDAVNAACSAQITNALTEQLSGIRIRCMMVDEQDHLWICTYGSGLLEIEPDGSQYLYNRDNGSFGNRSRLAVQLSDGTILACGDTGISYIRDHKIIRTIGHSEGLINSMILTAVEMPDHRVLAGTDGDGIAVLTEDGQVEKMLTREDGLSSEVILRMVRDEKADGIFIVTSNGLCYLEADKTIRTLDHFPYFNNYDLWLRDEDTFFVMSSAGIFIVTRDEMLNRSKGINYDLLDSTRGLNSALTANSWNYFNKETGRLFLPCDTGVFIINTNQYQSPTKSYRMMVTAVGQDGRMQRVDNGSPIRVGRNVNKLEIQPEILNYTIQDPYVGFWMEGFDEDWIVMPQSNLSTIVYSNLPIGTYTFHLGVLDMDQTTLISERVYTVVKEKEIYDNAWFIAYMLLVPMIAVAWFTWFVVRTRTQRTLELQQRELAMARQQIQLGNETIFAIAKAVDAKDERTSQHSQRVSQYSEMIGRAMGLPEEECENLRRTALMHDIGKIGIPDSILNKPARLTDEEYGVMKTHTMRGAEILKGFTLIDHVVEGAKYHHERYDGRGYPSGLKGEEIPLFGRIIGVADAFDAMTANRVYRKQLDFNFVLEELHKGRGTQFDPQVADIMLKLIDDGKIDLKVMYGVKDEDGAAQNTQAPETEKGDKA